MTEKQIKDKIMNIVFTMCDNAGIDYDEDWFMQDYADWKSDFELEYGWNIEDVDDHVWINHCVYCCANMFILEYQDRKDRAIKHNTTISLETYTMYTLRIALLKDYQRHYPVFKE